MGPKAFYGIQVRNHIHDFGRLLWTQAMENEFRSDFNVHKAPAGRES